MEELLSSRRTCGHFEPAPKADWESWIPANLSHSSFYNFGFNLVGAFIATPNNETNHGLYKAIIDGGAKNVSNAFYETFPKGRFWTTYVFFLLFLLMLFGLTIGKFLYFKYWNKSGMKHSNRPLRLVTRLILLGIAYTCLLWSAYMYKSSLADRQDNFGINFNNTKQMRKRMDTYNLFDEKCALKTANISKPIISKMFKDFQDGLLGECTGINSIPQYNFTYLQSHLNSTLQKSQDLYEQIQEIKGFVITYDRSVLDEFSSYQMMFEDIVFDLKKYSEEVERVRSSMEISADIVKRSYDSNRGNMQNWMVSTTSEELIEELQRYLDTFSSISDGVMKWQKDFLDFMRHYADRFEYNNLDDINNGFFVVFLTFLGFLLGGTVITATVFQLRNERGYGKLDERFERIMRIVLYVGVGFFGIFMLYYVNNFTNIVPHANLQRSVCETIARSPSYKNESNFFHLPAFENHIKTTILNVKTKKEEPLKIDYSFSEVMSILMTTEDGTKNKLFATDFNTEHFNKTIETWKEGMELYLKNFSPVNLTDIDQQTYHQLKQSFESLLMAGNQTGYMPNFYKQHKIAKLFVKDIETLMQEVTSVEWSLVANGNRRLKRNVITQCKTAKDYAEGIEKIGQEIISRTMKAYELIQKQFIDQDLRSQVKDGNKLLCEAMAGPSSASLFFGLLMLLFWSLAMLILLKTALDWDHLEGHSQAPISTADPHSAPLVDKIEESIYHNPIAEI